MEVEKHDWVTKVSVSEDQRATFNKLQGEILLQGDKQVSESELSCLTETVAAAAAAAGGKWWVRRRGTVRRSLTDIQGTDRGEDRNRSSPL